MDRGDELIDEMSDITQRLRHFEANNRQASSLKEVMATPEAITPSMGCILWMFATGIIAIVVMLGLALYDKVR